MHEITRMVVVLSLIAGVCSAALTSANYLLDPYVNKQTDLYVRGPALQRLFNAPADELLENKITMSLEEVTLPVFFTTQDGSVDKLAVEVSSQGYGGTVKLMVGVDMVAEKLTGIEVVSHAETPGLGARIEEAGFRRQWKGLPIDQQVAITADGGVIDAISGASATSRAAASGTNDVLGLIRAQKDEIYTKIAQVQEEGSP